MRFLRLNNGKITTDISIFDSTGCINFGAKELLKDHYSKENG